MHIVRKKQVLPECFVPEQKEENAERPSSKEKNESAELFIREL